MVGQHQDGEALGHASLKPCGEFRGGVAVGREELGQGDFGLCQGGCVPNGAPLGADALAVLISTQN